MRQMIINENDYDMFILKLNHASCVSELLITDSECHSWGGNTVVGTLGAVAQTLEEVNDLLGKAKIQA